MTIPEKIIRDMKPWYEAGKHGGEKFPAMASVDVRSRTREQIAWDSAILTASEYVRRRLQGLEHCNLNAELFAGEILGLLTNHLKGAGNG